jgi:transposase InsO family protein
MRVHRNAKTTPKGRALIVQRVEADGWTVAETAAAFGVSARTVYKWRRRHRHGGAASLGDAASVPRRMPRLTRPARVAAVRALRAQRLAGAVIAHRLGLPRSTVGAVLRRCGLGRLRPLESRPPVRRYERAHAGDLLHVDIKTLGRIARVGHRIHGDWRGRPRGIGWEHVHVCVDDASRVAYVEVLPTLTERDASGFLQRAVAWFAARGVRVERVMTDNGAAYRARAFRALCAQLAVRHLRTRPYRPQTNGKAERFIQTLLREWAYRRPYPTSRRRRRALGPWLRYYNARRPHTALRYQPPLTRLQASAGVNNVPGCNT